MVKYRDVGEFKTDRKFLDYAANISSYLERRPLEFLEERIIHETRMARERLETDGLKTQIRRHFLIKQLFEIYTNCVKPEDMDPVFAETVKIFDIE